MAPVTGSRGETDPLFIAQGVSFEPAQDFLDCQASRFKSGIDLSGPANWHQIEEFDVKCKLRDIAGERATTAETAKNPEGFRENPSDWGWYWGDTGVGAPLNAWQILDDRNFRMHQGE